MEKRAAPVSFSLLVHSLHFTIKLGIINLITYFRKQLKEEKTVEKLLDIMLEKAVFTSYFTEI